MLCGVDTTTDNVLPTIIVITKVPGPHSKTRLRSLLGTVDTPRLATALLVDTLSSLSLHLQVPCRLILYFAPSTQEEELRNILETHSIPVLDKDVKTNDAPNNWTAIPWTLMPMPFHQLASNNLSQILMSALDYARQSTPGTTTLFLGMDAPEVPLDEVRYACRSRISRICPAADGGYTLLSVPPTIPPCFDGVLWSHALTCVSQIKAIQQVNGRVEIGRLVHDVDTSQDVIDLQRRLMNDDKDKKDDRGGVLSRRPPAADDSTLLQTGPCWFVRQVLQDLVKLE